MINNSNFHSNVTYSKYNSYVPIIQSRNTSQHHFIIYRKEFKKYPPSRKLIAGDHKIVTGSYSGCEVANFGQFYLILGKVFHIGSVAPKMEHYRP